MRAARQRGGRGSRGRLIRPEALDGPGRRRPRPGPFLKQTGAPAPSPRSSASGEPGIASVPARRGAVIADRPARPELTYAEPAERQIKMLGSLPVIFSFCRRLGIAAIIDDLVPIREVAAVTAGRAVEAMVCNRLTSPAPLVHVQDWASTGAVPEILGITPASLNDDKLGPHPGCDRPLPGPDHLRRRRPRHHHLRYRHLP